MPAHFRIALLFALVAGPAHAGPLSPADARYLESLVPAVLFDPTGARRVRIRYEVPRNGLRRWSRSDDPTRDGWLVKGKWGSPARIHFTDGVSIPAPSADQIRHLDFIKQVEQFFTAHQPPDADTGEWVQKTAKKVFGDSDSFLTMAAWLHRLGHDRYAAEALDLARAFSEDPAADLRHDLANWAFDCLFDGFQSGADDRALAHGERYLSAYAATDSKKDHAAAMVADLKRRQKAGTFGKTGPKALPGGFETWDAGRKAAFLIESLDQCQADSSPGIRGVKFFEDFRVVALIRLGESVVPALLDVIEKDTRLTRVPELGGPQRFHSPTGRMIGVREPAATVVMSILKMSCFPPAPGEDADADWETCRAARLRHYWKTYGAMPFAERMMRHLKDESAPEEVWRHAAENLARWDVDRRFGPRGERTVEPAGWKRRPNPEATKFKDPTMAEAILGALDRDWAIQFGRGPTAASLFWMLDGRYLEYLVDLGDRRIGPELGRRAAANSDQDMRRRYAFAALRLGAPTEWKRFAGDVERGVLPLENVATRDSKEPATFIRGRELWRVVAALIRAEAPESDRALAALTAPTHPYFLLVRTAMQNRWDTVWPAHPFCLAVLRHGLHDDQPTGESYRIDKEEFVRGPDGGFYAMHYEEWADLRRFHTEVEERVCDAAGLRLSELVLGMPFFHPLCKDADDRITRLIRFLDTYRGRIRVATEQERNALRVREDRAFIPDIKPLGRPATAADVKAGLAVFHLDGKGRIWTGPIPATVKLKAGPKGVGKVGLVVQAEADADGKAVYGVLFRHEMRKARADEVE